MGIQPQYMISTTYGQIFCRTCWNFKERFTADIQVGNKALIRKVEQLFRELSDHPYEGTGKPEQLKYQPLLWSRRLDKKNRIRYTVHEDIVTVFVLSALGHYGDK